MKKYTKRFVIGDIHGNYRGLLQCIERSGFNSATDQLIVLGDVVDGYPDTKECIDYLITIPNLILIIGNHCQWYIDWMKTGAQPSIWVKQGGQATLRSVFHTFNQSHLDFFNKGHYLFLKINVLIMGTVMDFMVKHIQLKQRKNGVLKEELRLNNYLWIIS